MRQSGFSMVELIIVIVISSILAVIALPILQTGFHAYFSQRDLSDANWQGRLALARISRDLSSLPSTGNISTAGSTQLTFVDNNNLSVSYALSNSNLQRNTKTLANGIGSINFAYYDSTGAVTATIANIRYVGVTLNVIQNNTNFNLSSLLSLRNIVP